MKAESESGCRYSVLLKLLYFNAPRMLIVDPMHNLFLRSAKHFLKLLIMDPFMGFGFMLLSDIMEF